MLNGKILELAWTGIGALVGTLLALQFNFWLCPLGLIAGGGLAYILYDPKELVGRLKPSWEKYTATFREDKEFWRLELRVLPYGYAAMATPLICATLAVCLAWILLSVFGVSFTVAKLITMIVPVFILWLSLCLLMTLAALSIDYQHSDKSVARGQRLLDDMKAIYKMYSLKTVAAWILPHIWTAIVFCGVSITYLTLTYGEKLWNNRVRIRQYIVDSVVKIQSDNRLLCVAAAVIGTLIGVLFGSIILGIVVAVATYIFGDSAVAKKWQQHD